MDSDGAAVGGITGFLKTMQNLLLDCSPSRLVVFWDGPGGSSRRRRIYSEYKEGRKVRVNREFDQPPSRDFGDMESQLKLLKSILPFVGALQVEVPSIEADDSIAFFRMLALDDNKVVASSDRDMLQLVDAYTVVYSHSTKSFWDVARIVKEMGVLPENYVFVKALVGDGSDNIEGLKGIGPKTAVKLFPFLAESPCSLADVLDHARANVGKNHRYQGVLDGSKVLSRNVELMQLSNPTISPDNARQIRISSLEKDPKFSPWELKLVLGRRGIEVDPGLFGAVNSLKHRSMKP